MTLTPKEGIPLALVLALLAFLTFLCGVWVGWNTPIEQHVDPPRYTRRVPKEKVSLTEPCKPRWECTEN